MECPFQSGQWLLFWHLFGCVLFPWKVFYSTIISVSRQEKASCLYQSPSQGIISSIRTAALSDGSYCVTENKPTRKTDVSLHIKYLQCSRLWFGLNASCLINTFILTIRWKTSESKNIWHLHSEVILFWHLWLSILNSLDDAVIFSFPQIEMLHLFRSTSFCVGLYNVAKPVHLSPSVSSNTCKIGF